MRWDLDGDGLSDTDVNRSDYNTAFPLPESGKVCQGGGEGEDACVGYELTADLDFDENDDGKITRADATYWNSGSGWQPIGFSSSRAFTGVFDGGGHAIANLRVNRPSSDYIGLFGYIGSGGEVRNLGLAGVDVTGDDYVGGLAGYNSGGTIRASYAAGTASGDDYVGGLAGYNNSGTINGSYAAGTVTGRDDFVGGLAGHNNRGTINGSYAAGTVSGDDDYVGGLVGYNYYGTISASYAAGTVSGDDVVGGLAGSNYRGTISASYYDSQTSGLTAGAEGKTTAELQAPSDYTGIYADWNLDLDGDSANDDPWDFGTNAQYPALKADFDGDNTATWQEFGYQVRKPLSLDAGLSGVQQVSLSWPDVTETAWTGSPEVSYALYRSGSSVAVYNGASGPMTTLV